MNIGPQYQAEIPALREGGLQEALQDDDHATLLWSPSDSEGLSDEQGETRDWSRVGGGASPRGEKRPGGVTEGLSDE